MPCRALFTEVYMKDNIVNNESYIIEMRDIVKRFGKTVANDHASLKVRKGEIHAILGENGAGKTTLMSILYGLYLPDEGEILFDGSPVKIKDSAKAISLGIGMVHQHFMLVQPFTVVENIILGNEPLNKFGKLDLKTATEKVGDLARQYGLQLDLQAKIEDISVGMQQRVEILKALYRGAEVLILDEPTAALTPLEIEELGVIMKNLCAEGKTIIIITHKLNEIKEFADRCTIMRHGQTVSTFDVAEVSIQTMANEMVGRQVDFVINKSAFYPKQTLLEVSDLHAKDYRDVEVLNGLSLEVRAGEIVGIAGVDGNGQSELAEILSGLKKAESGKITLNGKDIFNATPKQIFDAGLSNIPEDRQKYGLILDLPVAQNLVIQNVDREPYSKKGIMQYENIERYAQRQIDRYDIRPYDSAPRPARSLSGGNQQKVIVAREMENAKDVLVAVNPTRGLDVGAIEYVHRYLVNWREQEKGLLLISFDLDEIMSLSDTILVIFKGQIVAKFNAKDADVNTLGLYMTSGGKTNEKE